MKEYTIEELSDKEEIKFTVNLPRIQPTNSDGVNTVNDIQSRASGNLVFSDGGSGKISMNCSWTAVQNPANNSSTVTATLTIKASLQGNCLSGSHLTIDGNKKTFNQYLNHPSGTPTITLCTHTVTLYHDANGYKSFNISASFVWNGYAWVSSSVGGVNFNTLSGSNTVSLDRILIVPNKPNINSIMEGYYESGMSNTVYWSMPSYDNIESYEVEYQTWNHVNGSYSPWYVIAYLNDKTATRFTIGHEHSIETGIRCRVRAKNGNLYSEYSNPTEWNYHSGIRIYDGHNWHYGKVKVWNGSSWSQGYVSVLQDSRWQ